MMTPAGCVSSTCAALAEFWGQVAGAPQFGGQVYSADCAAGTPGEQSMCKNAAAAGLFHPTEMMPVVTFWDGRDWSPYSGKRSLEALAQAIMGALTAPVPDGGGDGYDAAAAAAAAALSAPEDAEDAARLVCMQRAFQQPAALASSLPPKRPLRPADVPPVKRFSSFTQNSTVELPGAAAQPVSTGEIVWPPPMDLVSKLHVLPAVVRPEEVEAIRDLVGNTPLAFDSDPDTVDGMMSHEMFVSNPELRAGGEGRGGSLKLDADPAHLAARRPLREALEAIMQPILTERITPFVRQQYAANWKEGTPIGDWSTLTPCYSLIRRYKEGERRSHETHYDQHAIVTVVVSLADFETEYTGGLYVAAGRAGRQVLPLSRGDAAVHGPDLLHGVGVESGERWSWILWYRDSPTCDDHSGEWFTECAAAGNAVCEALYAAGPRAESPSEKIRWNEKAASHGLSFSMTKLARAHLKRLPSPLPYNPAAAAAWYTKGVEMWAEPDGHYGLAQMLLTNETSPEGKDDRVAAAVAHLEAAVGGGHSFAAYNLGVAHLFGHGLPAADPAAAAAWFEKSGLPEGFDAVALHHEANGRREEAEAWAARARRLGGGAPWRKGARERTGTGGAGGVSLHSAWPEGPCRALLRGGGGAVAGKDEL